MPTIATSKTVEFLMSLIRERQQAVRECQPILDMFTRYGEPHQWPQSLASNAIRIVKGLPRDPDESMPDIVAQAIRQGVNKYANSCTACGHMVNAGEGYYYTDERGKYVNHHKAGACPTGPAPAPLTVAEGLYVVDGKFIVLTDTADYGLVGSEWNNTTGMLKRMRGGKRIVMSSGRPATPDEMEQFANEIGTWGRSVHKCCFCNTTLTDPRSEMAGYGPTCAGRYGLPWG